MAGPTSTEQELSTDDLSKYQQLVRSDAGSWRDLLERSQEFIGQEKPTTRPVQDLIKPKHKWGAPESPEQFRPDDWLGSPSSAKRKSYKVKGVTSSLPAPSLVEPEATSTSSTSTPVPVPPSPSFGRNSTHTDLKPRTTNQDGSSPDPELYKMMLQESIHSQEDDALNRSMPFLGGETREPLHALSAASPMPGKKKWGPPKAPEQFRPDSWLTGGPPSPMASKARKSYTVKESPVSVTPRRVIPGLTRHTLGGTSSHHKNTWASSTHSSSSGGSLTDDKPLSNSSFGAPKPPVAAPSTPSGSPREYRSKAPKAFSSKSRSQSMPVNAAPPPRVASSDELRRSQHSPISKTETVDRNKFLSSFAAFEKQGTVPQIFNAPATPTSERRKKKTTIKKKSKSALLPMSDHIRPSWGTNSTVLRKNVTSLDQAIANLRRVSGIRPSVTKDNRAEQQASEIMGMLRHLRSTDQNEQGSELFLSILGNLRQGGILETYLDRDEIVGVQQIAKDLRKTAGGMGYSDPARIDMEVCMRLVDKLTPTNANASAGIEDLLNRLRKTLPKLSQSRQEVTNQIIQDLEVIAKSVAHREQDELSNVIRNIDDDKDTSFDALNVDELTRVLAQLDRFGGDVTNSFSGSFHGSNHGPPPSRSADNSPCSSPWRRAGATVSPSPGAKRNFKVSPKARAKSMRIASLPFDTPSLNQEDDELQLAINNLRKIVQSPSRSTADKNQQCASEIMNILKTLKSTGAADESAQRLSGVVRDLREHGVLNTTLGPNRMGVIRKIATKLDQLANQLDPDDYAHTETQEIIREMKTLSSTCPDAIEKLQRIVPRLKALLPDVDEGEQRSIVENAVERLDAILKSMLDGEEKQLADAIGNLNVSDSSGDNFTNLVSALQEVANSKDVAPKESSSAPAPRTLSIERIEAMVSALVKLENAKLSHREAGEVASLLRNLKKPTTPQEDKDSEDAIFQLKSAIKSNRKYEGITPVLRNLRDIDLNDRDRSQMALYVMNLGTGKGPLRDELQQAIANLRKVTWSKPETEHVNNILSNLRKAYRKQFDVDNAPEMVQLSKVLGPERTELVRELYKGLQPLKLKDNEIRRFLQAIDMLGVDDTPEESFVSADLDDEGVPRLSFNVPRELEERDCMRHIQPRPKSKTREFHYWIEKDLDASVPDFGIVEDSDYEVESDSEESAKIPMLPSIDLDTDDESIGPIDDESTFVPPVQEATREDILAQAIANLKNVDLTQQEAAAVALIARNLKKPTTDEEEKASNNSIAKLEKRLSSPEKYNEVADALKKLRSVGLSDHDRENCAFYIRGLGGTEGKWHNEITEAIANLRKVKLNKNEAKDVSRIMFNLRKVAKQYFDIDQSREMITLRKVMGPERAAEIANVFKEVGVLGLKDKEIDRFVHTVTDLGVEPTPPGESDLISVDLFNGVPCMSLPTSGQVMICPGSVDKSVPKAPSYEIEVKTPMSSPVPGPKRYHHYSSQHDDVEKELSKAGSDDEKEKKIRFTNKHQWRFKKHNKTVVREKVWRFEEDWNVDEAIWSPLSRDQYDRRKTVGAAMLKTMGDDASIDDMLLDEFEPQSPRAGPRTPKRKSKSMVPT